jgi:hypothetical protein
MPKQFCSALEHHGLFGSYLDNTGTKKYVISLKMDFLKITRSLSGEE